eukprot:GFUD01078744.1.p1 GENE.GFUD01078744.1~~GFUD01078744.1.p1  ORF type:complete len:326 (-),score=81.75 GFUD01078744.1:41-1018(-)
MKTIIWLVVLIIGATAFPQAETGCGQDERGVSRKPGDRWQEDCNRCRCLTAGIPGCTKKFCGDFPSLFAPQEKECRDSLGNTREEGGQWEDGPEICSCGGGVVVCTTLIAITDVKRDKPSSSSTGGINFPGSKQQTKEDSSTCTDAAGKKRLEGESWKEECNRCGCFSGVSACTEVFCINIDEDFRTATPALFEADLTRDVSSTVQCKQEGVKNCRAVTLNLEYLETTVKPGDSVNFISGTDLSMKLRRAPSGSPTSTMSYSFTLSDGGEATMSVRPNKGKDSGPSVYASIKPITGTVLYSVESCGQGCNVLYERDLGFFNQFED